VSGRGGQGSRAAAGETALCGASFGRLRDVKERRRMVDLSVIVVTFNYRGGTFGWMVHPDLTKESGNLKFSGNYGLLDMIAVLKWVQKNIAAFGGEILYIEDPFDGLFETKECFGTCVTVIRDHHGSQLPVAHSVYAAVGEHIQKYVAVLEQKCVVSRLCDSFKPFFDRK
jgi:hypothetical protein